MDTPSGSAKEFFNSTKKTEAAWIIHPDLKMKFKLKKGKKNFSNPKQNNCKESFPPKKQKWCQKGSKIAISNVLSECMRKGLEKFFSGISTASSTSYMQPLCKKRVYGTHKSLIAKCKQHGFRANCYYF